MRRAGEGVARGQVDAAAERVDDCGERHGVAGDRRCGERDHSGGGRRAGHRERRDVRQGGSARAGGRRRDVRGAGVPQGHRYCDGDRRVLEQHVQHRHAGEDGGGRAQGGGGQAEARGRGRSEGGTEDREEARRRRRREGRRRCRGRRRGRQRRHGRVGRREGGEGVIEGDDGGGGRDQRPAGPDHGAGAQACGVLSPSPFASPLLRAGCCG